MIAKQRRRRGGGEDKGGESEKSNLTQAHPKQERDKGEGAREPEEKMVTHHIMTRWAGRRDTVQHSRARRTKPPSAPS